MVDQGIIGYPLLTETSFPIAVIAKNGSLVPSTPTSATWRMYSQDWGSPITTGSYSIDTDSRTGFCTATINLSLLSSLESGKIYTILSTYVVSSVTYREMARFQPQ